MEQLLHVKNLEVEFRTYAGVVKAVRGIEFQVNPGEVVAIVGESGCGKSVTAQSIMRLIPSPPGRITGGSIIFDGENLLNKTERQMQKIRGNTIGMIFQDPMTYLNPVLTIATQITENLRLHKRMNKEQAMRRAVELFGLVGIPEPEIRLKQYPHQFSGGMRQRVMIAMALACEPKLIIADEPTTALDVTVQAQILELIKGLKDRFQTAIILITHDLGVVAGQADRILVMYAGQIVETGTTDEVLKKPSHPYTWGLLKSVPRLDAVKGKKLTPIWGQPPDLLQDFTSCPFVPRCDYAMSICAQQMPPFFNGNKVRCWLNHPQAPKVKFKKEVS
ncbi:MAG: ABC transporter ATP-binding protein [Dethiobacteria bacterium]|nr:ABC transporter ATP-binding protein [Bacillota bacterium]NMD32585.1 ABC transporter ATP-binding protein [Bacillota bacterium]HOB28785.1 ABC transporter ATP-binding protein [Bacillota bacterium]HPZ41737.1 ABC transporter ATP-binding protein [Bacillota bacterium]HQD52538.1 ABC transporter ATP-binding protein [Bacillota bacterium]